MNRSFTGILCTFALPVVLALSGFGAARAQGLSSGDINTGYFGNVAIKGYDPVAYFTMGKATPGDPAISAEWLGAEWYFANTRDRDLFVADPIAYAAKRLEIARDLFARQERRLLAIHETGFEISGLFDGRRRADGFRDRQTSRVSA